MRWDCPCASRSVPDNKTTWRRLATLFEGYQPGRCSPIAPTMPTACMTSFWTKARAGHTATPSSQIPARLRSCRLPPTIGHRELLCQAQTMAAHSNALRQACRQLPGVHKARKHHAMDQIVKSSPQPSRHISKPHRSQITCEPIKCGLMRMFLHRQGAPKNSLGQLDNPSR